MLVSRLTIESLDSNNIVISQAEFSSAALIPWIHDSVLNIRMLQTEAVASLVSSDPQEISSVCLTDCELLVIVEMHVSADCCDQNKQIM